MLVSKLLSFGADLLQKLDDSESESDDSSEASESCKNLQMSDVAGENIGIQSSNDNYNNEKITEEKIQKHVNDIKKEFDRGQYSIENSRYETEEQAIDAFRNLMHDFNDKEKVMGIMYRYGIETSPSKQDANFRNPGVVDYDRDEAIRRNR